MWRTHRFRGGQREVLPAISSILEGPRGEQPDPGLSLVLDHMETKLRGSGAGERRPQPRGRRSDFMEAGGT